MSNIQRDALSPGIEQRLHQIVQSADAAVSRRALLILRWHQSVPVSAIAKEVGMSASGVNHWLKLYRERGMGLFDGTGLSTEPEEAPRPEIAPQEPEPILEEAPEPEKPRRTRKPKIEEPPAPEPIAEPVFEAPIEPVMDADEAPKARRGRKKIAPPEPESVVEIASPEPAPVAEQAEEIAPPKPRRGRKPQITSRETEAEPERITEREPDYSTPYSMEQAVEEITLPEPLPPEPSAPPELPDAPQPETLPPTSPEVAPLEAPTPEPTQPEPEIEPPQTEPSSPAPDVSLATVAPTTITPVPRAPEPIRETIPPPHITSVTQLVNYYGIRLNHAQYVTDLSLALFDATAEIHRLPDNTRRLLEAGALLHNVAYEIDPADHHTRGRDMILSTPLRDFSLDERRMIALLTAFHRKKVRPEREPIYLQLAPELRSDTLAMAAILRNRGRPG